jgi:methylated-DNA-[protein]-cysteine S-methyltransferase
MTDLAWGTLSAPVGRLSVGCGQAGVSQIRWGYPPGGPRPLDAAAGPAAQQCSAALGQLGEYFAGQRRQFEVPVDWSGMSRLQRQVLGVLLHTVGYGETVSYGTLARRAQIDGRIASLPARAIGRIMGSNPIPVIVPCHRVVAADGLGGYSGGTGGNGLEVKRWLLSFEGALPPELDFSLASSEV